MPSQKSVKLKAHKGDSDTKSQTKNQPRTAGG